jgi:DNA-binding CsgD family transcriptional regulator
LEGIAAGVVLVDAQMGIVYANATAQAMLETGDPLQDRGGKLAISSSLVSSVLGNAVAQAALKESALERRSIDVPVLRIDGTPAVIQVLPLRHRALRSGLEQRTAAAVFVSNAADPPRLPADAMALLYDLTPAETRVFELVVEGRTPADIADLLALKLATVRTHLSRVFEKTGCARQSDLVGLASRLTLPV